MLIGKIKRLKWFFVDKFRKPRDVKLEVKDFGLTPKTKIGGK